MRGDNPLPARAFWPAACAPWVFATCLTLLLGSPVRACNVPVFRYALEHWPADRYEVIVFQRGPLDAAGQAMVDVLKKCEDDVAVGANLHFHRVDLSQPHDESMAALFQAQKEAELPWLVVRYPDTAHMEENVWAGRLRQEAVQALLHSPARREIAGRILKGESAVWVLLQSGDKVKDSAAQRLLETQLPKLQQTLKLPERTTALADRVVGEETIPLRLAFSVILVAREDPAEHPFVRMLLGSEPDLAERSEPMVFPVFGRGRLLYALVGKGITAQNVEETANYLIGACSCEVKRQHPGVDLLLSTDWDALFEGRELKEPEPPDLVGLSRFVPPAAPAGNEEAAVPPPATSATLAHALLLALAVVLLILVAATLLVLHVARKRQAFSSAPLKQ